MRVAVFLFAVAGVFAVPDAARAADEVTVSELIELSAAFSGVEVVVEGELIGDYGFRRDGWMWTQLNGDAYARAPIRGGGDPVGGNTGIGVRMPIRLAEGLDPPGGYRKVGPLVSVTGVWKHHDPERQGESYLEVKELAVVRSGQTIEQRPQWPAMLAGAVILVISGLIWRRSGKS